MTVTADAAHDTPQAPELRRVIGRKTLLVFVVGDVLGAGIYALVGEVGAETGGAIWTAFTLALVLAVFTAFAYAELVTKYPQAAGAALYVNKAFRVPFVSFMVAFAVMASGVTSASTLSRAFGGDYLKVFVDVPVVVTALIFIVVVACINFRGIAESVKLNLGLTAIEVTGLLLICLIALAAIVDGGGGTDTARAFDFKADESVIGAMVGGAGLAFYALIGFEDSVNVAEETKEPERNYPIALFGGLAVAGTIYIAVTILASMAVPTGRLTESTGPLIEVAQVGPLSIDPKIFSAIALFALANGALINMVMASRLLYGMSNQGILPGMFGRVHRTRHTPYVAIIATTGLAMVLISTGDLGDLADMTVFLLLGVFIMVNISVLVLRRDKVRHAHFKAPSAIPVIGAVVCLALMVFETEGRIALRALFLLAVGAILFGITWFSRSDADRRRFDTQTMAAIESPGG
jgi:APA family basic amino acid/polyamine antiporter